MPSTATPNALTVGQFVAHPLVPGIARVAAYDGATVQVDAFESVASPVAHSWSVAANECLPVRLLEQTRVYWEDPDTGRWRPGRVVGGGPETYFVRIPNRDQDFPVPQAQLRVRWDRPVRSPADVLAVGANESPRFRDARLPMLRSLVAQRAACASLPALLSAAVEIYPHQVQTAMTVLRDPVQRYLLADEVGLGKTIEAGLIVRQHLLDHPRSRVLVLVPAILRQQWQTELQTKFFIDDFPAATLWITSHETPHRWHEYHGYDLVVVDEAHRLCRTEAPDQSPYRELAALARSTPRLLLLSATPTTARAEAHLALLHLLDASLYRWEDLADFTVRFEGRRDLARAVYGLDADFEPLLPGAVAGIKALIPDDTAFQGLADKVVDLLTDDGDLLDEAMRPALHVHVDALRAHISETYRLHRRVIRHRRHNVVATGDDTEALPFEVTGRQRPASVTMRMPRAARNCDILLNWQQQAGHWLLDHEIGQDAGAYGQVLAVLCSRVDELSSDLDDALRWRMHRDEEAATRAGLSVEERQVLASVAVLPADKYALNRLIDDPAESWADLGPLTRILARHQRNVVFCGAGSLAARLVDCLVALPGLSVVEHSRRQDAAAGAVAVARWREHGGTLVVDDTAEDGVNLQDADAVIHLRLPWSPNRCEQRLGRVDRFAGVFGKVRPPAQQFVVSIGETEEDFTAAWSVLLVDSVKIFDDSVSALQDALERVMASAWEAALREGPAAMLRTSDAVAAALAHERREIDGMDMLEAVHEGSLGRTLTEMAIATETQWAVHERAMRGYAGDGPGGLQFTCHTLTELRNAVRFERGALLVSPRLLALAGHPVPTPAMTGAFNRNTALRHPGLRMLRLGNPFVDILAQVIEVDDRGQASAFWRRGLRNAELRPYIGLDFLVEAAIDEALDLVPSSPDAQRALRRQADLIFRPFMRRVWLPAGSSVPVVEPELLRWLNRPFEPDRGDLNLSETRIGVLWDCLGGPDGLTAAARQAEHDGHLELALSADLVNRGRQAEHEAARALAVRQAQALARQRAGRLLSDTESYLTDVRVTAALIAGLGRPRLRLMAITCLVGGDLRPETRDA
ncbi:ATP-dependent helicase HepA [Micromonospora haikouensis]|uniref:ATP-dependent helicase HepA n=1 Tax=Micromonospora haikouensis TaxID=686309 RepID=A0A1C4YJN3_9ACTN|nr:protein DpdE [Micromonospora haikouensis]SCF20972.1 ATP-dependent helicase HepA [Micromonospora haikouensis]